MKGRIPIIPPGYPTYAWFGDWFTVTVWFLAIFGAVLFWAMFRFGRMEIRYEN